MLGRVTASGTYGVRTLRPSENEDSSADTVEFLSDVGNYVAGSPSSTELDEEEDTDPNEEEEDARPLDKKALIRLLATMTGQSQTRVRKTLDGLSVVAREGLRLRGLFVLRGLAELKVQSHCVRRGKPSLQVYARTSRRLRENFNSPSTARRVR